MPRRTIEQARSIYESRILPAANEWQRTKAEEAMKAAEDQARSVASARAEVEAADIAERIKAAQQVLTEVRDELEALVAEGTDGRIDAATYSRRMKAATDRERAANADLRRLDERVEELATLEADPLGWYDSMAQRFPVFRVDVPW